MNEESKHYHKKPHSEVSLHSLWNSTNGLTNFDYQLKQLTASVEQLQANQPSAKKLSKLGKGVKEKKKRKNKSSKKDGIIGHRER